MLDFRLDEEQQMLVAAIDRFATEKIRKGFREAEEAGEMPQKLAQAGWEIGLLPTAIPEVYGGFGDHSAVTGVVALEAFATGDLAVALHIMTPNLAAIPLLLAGSQAQKACYLPRFVDEELPCLTAAFTEPVYQFDPRLMDTTAVSHGDGYTLNGTKIYVPLAEMADTILVWANEGGQTNGFLVPIEAEGVVVAERDKLLGVRGLATYKVHLQEVQLPATARLGEGGGCDFNLILNRSRIALAALAVGVARAGYEYAREYAKQRVQFDRPIAQNQSIAFLLADMASDVESARMMVWEAAWLLDQGQDVTREAAVMKQFVDQAVVRVADAAVQVLGGYGYIREYPVELWLRNARGFATFDGLAII